MSEKKTCGECAFFKTPKCTWANNPLKKGDDACGDFYSAKAGKEKPKKKKLKDSGFTEDGCFEAVYVDGKPRFLVKNSEDFNVVESVELNGNNFYPKEAKNVPYEPYGVFEGSTPNMEELFWKVRSEVDMFIDVEPIWKDVLATCVLLSYHQQKFQTVPYIFLYGDNESGKSTVLQILKSLCYRPMYGVTIPSADLYGYLEDSDSIGVILEDEVQGIHKDTDKIKIYKAGYKQGAVVPRTILTQYDRIIKYYGVFCFKAAASEQIPQVKGFNERFLFIAMVEGFPQKEWADITREDLERLRNLRDMLLKWRMQTREWELPNVQLSVKGRIKELWKPLLQITHGLTVYNNLFKFVEEQRKERLSGKQDTLEGHVVKVVTEFYNQAKELLEYIPFQTIWLRLASDLDGKIDEKKPHVMNTSEFFDVTKNKVGYRLREILSGKSKTVREKVGKDADGKDVESIVKAYFFDSEKLRRVAKKYGYELVTKLPMLPSSPGTQALQTMENKEKGDVENVENKALVPEELSYVSNLVTKLEDLKAPHWDPNEPLSEHECCVCGYKKMTSWQTEDFKGNKHWICEECKAEWEKQREVS